MNTFGGFYCECSDPELSLARDNRHCIGKNHCLPVLMNLVCHVTNLALVLSLVSTFFSCILYFPLKDAKNVPRMLGSSKMAHK